MTISTWTGAINSHWARGGNWSPAGKPGAGSDVVINSGAPVAVVAASIGTVHSIDNSSDLYFESADANTVTTVLDNSGHLYVDFNAGEGGTTLNIGGTLTNSDYLYLGNPTLSASDKVTAESLDNTGFIQLTGSGANQALLDASGTTTNSDRISIASDTEELAGEVGGTGSFSLSTANLQFDSSVSAGQTINETGKDALILEQAQSFAATISGFGTGDTIDAANFLLSGTHYNFVENSAGTGGTLTLTDTSLSLTAHIHLTGVYSDKSFSLAPDSGTGTLVKFA